MEKMIEFVLSRVPLRLLSFYPLPVSVNQIISLPCQHTLLVEQSKLICKRALWFFSPFPLSLSSPSFVFFFFFAQRFSELLADSSSFFRWEFFSLIQKERTSSLFHFGCTSFDETMNPVSSRWCLTLSQRSPATPIRDRVRSLVKGSLSTGFPL